MAYQEPAAVYSTIPSDYEKPVTVQPFQRHPVSPADVFSDGYSVPLGLEALMQANSIYIIQKVNMFEGQNWDLESSLELY